MHNNEKQKDTRIAYIDLLRCICAFAVVGIHITMTQPNNYSIKEIGTMNYIVLTSTYAIVQWAVPVFLMISGNLLLQAKQITLIKVRKYVLRMLLVLLVFGTAYAMMELAFKQRFFSLTMVPQAILMTLERNSWSHLWYLYVLIGIYFILIPLKRFVDNAENKEIYMLLLVLIIGDFMIPEINSVLGTELDNFMILSQYVAYFLMGYLISTIKVNRGGCVAAWIFATFIKILLNYVSVNKSGIGSPILLEDRVFTLIQAIAVYLIFMDCFKTKKLNRIEISISRCSFAIYLFHPLFINLLYKAIGIMPTSFANIYIAILLLWLAVFIISWAFSWLILKIPYFNNLL